MFIDTLKWIFIAVLGFVSCLCFSANTVLPVDGGSHMPLAGALEYAIDASGSVSAQQLYQQSDLLSFQLLKSKGTPAISTPIWFRFHLKNSSADDLQLVINFEEFLFDELRFYQRLDGELIQQSAGLNIPFSQWPSDYRFIAMPFTVAANSQSTFYFSVLASHMPMMAPTVSSSMKFASMTSLSSLLNLIVIGMVLGITLFLSIFMPLALESREAYGFVLYMSLATMVIMSISGIFIYPLGEYPQWHKFSLVAVMSINCITLSLLVNVFFNVYRDNPVLHKVYLVFSAAVACTVVFYPLLGGYERLIIPVIVSVSMMNILVLFTAALKYREKASGASLFFWAISFYFLTSLYTVLGVNDIVPYNALVRQTAGFGILVQAAMVCWAIAQKARQRRNAAEALSNDMVIAQASSQEKSNFLATMSHEIRTPVNGVLGMAQMLQLTPQSEEQSHFTQVIINSGHTLLAVINDILDFSKIEAGKLELDNQVFNLPEQIRYTSALFEIEASAKKLDFNIDIHPDCPEYLIADSVRLQQVLNNLLSNAFKFTHCGHVNLSINCLQSNEESVQLLFSVEDSGIGIAEDKQKELFQAFTQADRSTTRNYGGTGLGLAISQRLAGIMGGVITLTSQEAIGSVFTFAVHFSIPPAEQVLLPELNRVSAEYYPNKKSHNKTKSVLVAEDNPVNQQVISAMLGSLGVAFVLANDGLKALELYRQEQGRFDAILMDLEMPEKDGYSTAAAIRIIEAEQGRLRLPIIALTAHVLEENIQRCYEEGMDNVLTKPVLMPELIQALQQFNILEQEEQLQC